VHSEAASCSLVTVEAMNKRYVIVAGHVRPHSGTILSFDRRLRLFTAASSEMPAEDAAA